MSYQASTQNPVVNIGYTGLNQGLLGSRIPPLVMPSFSYTGTTTAVTLNPSQGGIIYAGPPVGTTLNFTLPSVTGACPPGTQFKIVQSKTGGTGGAWNVFTSNKNLLSGPVRMGYTGFSGFGGCTGIGTTVARITAGDRVILTNSGAIWLMDIACAKTGAMGRNP